MTEDDMKRLPTPRTDRLRKRKYANAGRRIVGLLEAYETLEREKAAALIEVEAYFQKELAILHAKLAATLPPEPAAHKHGGRPMTLRECADAEESAAERFLRVLAEHPYKMIVSSAALTTEAIAQARAENRMLVLADGLGFVIEPLLDLGPKLAPKAAAVPEGMVMISLIALEHLLYDCKHRSDIWRECYATLRQYKPISAPKPEGKP
jgi:hypothetical protein